MNTAVKIVSLLLGVMLVALAVMSAGCNTKIPVASESSAHASTESFEDTQSTDGAESTDSTEGEENSSNNTDESTSPEQSTSSEDVSSEESEDSGSEASEESSEDVIVDPSEGTGDGSPYGDDYYTYTTDISKFYEAIVLPDSPDKFLVLVNKENKLGRNDVPENLVDCVNTRDDGRDTQKLVYEAELALQAFLNEARAFGFDDVSVTSAYRGYYTQDYLFDKYVENELHKFDTREEAEEYVSTYSSRPGTSEHQTGLCVDMHNLSSASQSFGSTDAAKWLEENAYKFGFILRYPKDKEDVTEIMWEPWHFRFVGRYHATRIHELGLCLEEYIETYYPEQIQD